MENLYNLEFIGYSGREVITKLICKCTIDEYQEHFLGDPKKYIIDNHPEGDKIKIERAFAVLSPITKKVRTVN